MTLLDIERSNQDTSYSCPIMQSGCTLPLDELKGHRNNTSKNGSSRILPRTHYGYRTNPMEMRSQSGPPQDAVEHRGIHPAESVDHHRTSLDIEGPDRRTPGFGLQGPKTPGLEGFGISGFPGTRASNVENFDV